jgi:hypothetical protein
VLDWLVNNAQDIPVTEEPAYRVPNEYLALVARGEHDFDCAHTLAN